MRFDWKIAECYNGLDAPTRDRSNEFPSNGAIAPIFHASPTGMIANEVIVQRLLENTQLRGNTVENCDR
jgi:hypothetical protein